MFLKRLTVGSLAVYSENDVPFAFPCAACRLSESGTLLFGCRDDDVYPAFSLRHILPSHVIKSSDRLSSSLFLKRREKGHLETEVSAVREIYCAASEMRGIYPRRYRCHIVPRLGFDTDTFWF